MRNVCQCNFSKATLSLYCKRNHDRNGLDIWKQNYKKEFLARSFPRSLALWFLTLGIVNKSVTVAWSIESLPSYPATRVRSPAGSGILIPILGLGVCPFCSVLSPADALTLCWPHIQGGPPLCICLVFRSIDNCSPYRHLTHGYLGCKSRGCKF